MIIKRTQNWPQLKPIQELLKNPKNQGVLSRSPLSNTRTAWKWRITPIHRFYTPYIELFWVHLLLVRLYIKSKYFLGTNVTISIFKMCCIVNFNHLRFISNELIWSYFNSFFKSSLRMKSLSLWWCQISFHIQFLEDWKWETR